jgi:hypothetical protein
LSKDKVTDVEDVIFGRAKGVDVVAEEDRAIYAKGVAGSTISYGNSTGSVVSLKS